MSSVSFIVGSRYGPRSGKWNVAVQDRDVYINMTVFQRAWHVSLHESGENHFRSDRQGTPRYFTSYDDLLPANTYRVGVYIVIPDDCLHPATQPDRTKEPTAWLERPEYGGCMEIAVMVWDPRNAREE